MLKKLNFKNFKFKKLVIGKRRIVTYPLVILAGLFFLPITVLIVIGWYTNQKVKNKVIKSAVFIVLTFFFITIALAYVESFINPDSTPRPVVQNNSTDQRSTTSFPTTNQEVEKSSSVQIEITQTPSPTATPEPILNTQTTEALVTYVIDGDTIEIEGGQRVRYTGIDTPETSECFYSQSKKRNQELVEGKMVTLEKDVSEKDKYGRLLRYVYIEGAMVNELLVQEGYAQVSTYPPDVKYQQRFTSSQTFARNNNNGFWAGCAESQPTPTSSSPTTQTSAPGSCKYACTGTDKDCSDFSTHIEAQTFFECCGFTAENDPMRLDNAKGVGNGIACENLP